MWVKKIFKAIVFGKKQLIKIVWGKYPIELKAYLDLCTVRGNSMGKIKTWKIDVWFIENKNINRLFLGSTQNFGTLLFGKTL